MSHSIECPTCELVFQVDRIDEDLDQECPACGRQVNLKQHEHQNDVLASLAAFHENDDGNAGRSVQLADRFVVTLPLPDAIERRRRAERQVPLPPSASRMGANNGGAAVHPPAPRSISPPAQPVAPSRFSNPPAADASIEDFESKLSDSEEFEAGFDEISLGSHRDDGRVMIRPSSPAALPLEAIPDEDDEEEAVVLREGDIDASLLSASKSATEEEVTPAKPVPKALPFALPVVLIGVAGIVISLLIIAAIIFGLMQLNKPSAQSDAGGTGDPERLESVSDEEPIVKVSPLTSEEEDSIVAAVNGHAVTVEANFGDFRRVGSGILVNNNGWVLTTRSLVAGASEVAIETLELSNSGALPTSDDLDESNTRDRIRVSGMVTGMVSEDPDHDLILLKVNPSELGIESDLSLNDVGLPEPGTRLAIIGKASDIAGADVDSETEMDDASGSANTVFAAQAGEELSWAIVITKHGTVTAKRPFESLEATCAPLIGAPSSFAIDGAAVVDLNGNLVGITVVAARGHAYVVGMEHVNALLETASSSPSSLVSQPLAYWGDADEPERIRVPVASPDVNPGPAELGTVESIQTLEALFKQCNELEWQPSNDEEYNTFAQLAEYLVAAEEVAYDPDEEQSVRELMESSTVEIRKHLQTTGWPEQSEIEIVNQLALAKMKNESEGVYCFGKVLQTPGLAPRFEGSDSVVMELEGTGERIILPVSQSLSQLTSGSRWLIVGIHEPDGWIDVEGEEETSGKAAIVYTLFFIQEPEQVAG